MQQNNRQAFPLRRWASRMPKPTDPHFSGRGVLKPTIARYVAECFENNDAPELFMTAWADTANGIVTFGLAIPYEAVSQEHIPDLTGFFQ